MTNADEDDDPIIQPPQYTTGGFATMYPMPIDPAEILALIEEIKAPHRKWWQFWKKGVVDPNRWFARNWPTEDKTALKTETWLETIPSRRALWEYRLREVWQKMTGWMR